ncbi:MAG: T9SS type A sorting domain-containing protein [Ignavibacteria bacterium]|nr:T9SS type A sorting domain-containing protein [Ignavibacteria bacterium]
MQKALLLFLFLGCSVFLYSQSSIAFVPQSTTQSGTLGNDIPFIVELKNNTTQQVTVTIIRRLNNMPTANWTSSMCLGLCFSPFKDSIATTKAFGSTPLNPGETREFSLHVSPLADPGQGKIRIVARNDAKPSDSVSVDFLAIVPVAVNDGHVTAHSMKLEQNYPNPFNPSTVISYQTASSGMVSLVVSNIVGQEITTLVHGIQSAGSHSVSFNAKNLPSGLYYYTLQANGQRITRKMMLVR